MLLAVKEGEIQPPHCAPGHIQLQQSQSKKYNNDFKNMKNLTICHYSNKLSSDSKCFSVKKLLAMWDNSVSNTKVQSEQLLLKSEQNDRTCFQMITDMIERSRHYFILYNRRNYRASFFLQRQIVSIHIQITSLYDGKPLTLLVKLPPQNLKQSFIKNLISNAAQNNNKENLKPLTFCFKSITL